MQQSSSSYGQQPMMMQQPAMSPTAPQTPMMQSSASIYGQQPMMAQQPQQQQPMMVQPQQPMMMQQQPMMMQQQPMPVYYPQQPQPPPPPQGYGGHPGAVHPEYQGCPPHDFVATGRWTCTDIMLCICCCPFNFCCCPPGKSERMCTKCEIKKYT
ncbi:uncharacterized protein BJ171DRAFT_509274 [Polychytrium aggregatum]|uniref:uncharacterized protein n=1 Tax=Polychytrium aggregatum TaxID=110093 RepID=UPI0022FEEA8F|nr:uncharacterized protein BJ171DRAFT_509274 [Polychytrium aggregatum]KAI9203683.1 hypothetical protein BJ171DRAFT_509274 [Polychytrium aggregatum]